MGKSLQAHMTSWCYACAAAVLLLVATANADCRFSGNVCGGGACTRDYGFPRSGTCESNSGQCRCCSCLPGSPNRECWLTTAESSPLAASDGRVSLVTFDGKPSTTFNFTEQGIPNDEQGKIKSSGTWNVTDGYGALDSSGRPPRVISSTPHLPLGAPWFSRFGAPLPNTLGSKSPSLHQKSGAPSMIGVAVMKWGPTRTAVATRRASRCLLQRTLFSFRFLSRVSGARGCMGAVLHGLDTTVPSQRFRANGGLTNCLRMNASQRRRWPTLSRSVFGLRVFQGRRISK